MDFTLNTLRGLLAVIHDSGYSFLPVGEFFENKVPLSDKLIILRHDVDKNPANSLAAAHFESKMHIRGTYYFRIKPGSLDKGIIKDIASMGHEIGYHYEDMDLARQKVKVESRKSKGESLKSGINIEKELAEIAIKSFSDNLTKLRDIVPINTICMHGSPLSPFDSRVLWKYYDYSNFGITAEPYFDFSLEEMLYLTDTGRQWDGSEASIRDRAYVRDWGYYSDWVRPPVTGSAMAITDKGDALRKRFRFRKTDDIVRAAKSKDLPDRMLVTIHPQRWSESVPEWITELLIQNLKNPVKILVKRNRWSEHI